MINDTIRKFGYPETLVRDYEHWTVLLRPAQVTLGSLIVAAKSDVTDFGGLSAEHFDELKCVTTDVSATLSTLISHQKLNWLMLMMVDPHVHFHMIPRYEGTRERSGLVYPDNAWPGPPALGDAIKLSDEQITDIGHWIASAFRS